MAKKSKENYLDYVPKRNSLYEWSRNEDGNVEIKVLNKGLFNRIAQIFFKRPKISNIELEQFGSFIWENIDGESSIYQIGMKVKDQFGEQAEPLYERLSIYMKMLRDAGYIVYENKIKKKA